MPRTQEATAPAAKPKVHRSTRSTSKKPIVVSALAAVLEFDASVHQQEIAELAYRKWLERAGSAEEDWLKAEIEVRARYKH